MFAWIGTITPTGVPDLLVATIIFAIAASTTPRFKINATRYLNVLLGKGTDSKAIAHNQWLLVVAFISYSCIILLTC